MKSIKKKYGKTKWIDTPFSILYKRQLAANSVIGFANSASSYAQAMAHIAVIRSHTGDHTQKSIAMANSAIKTACMIKSQMNACKHRSSEIKAKWGVK